MIATDSDSMRCDESQMSLLFGLSGTFDSCGACLPSPADSPNRHGAVCVCVCVCVWRNAIHRTRIFPAAANGFPSDRIGVLSHEIGFGERGAMATWTFNFCWGAFVAVSHIQ